ncbi:MAG: sensor domain-containing diguanylate cyclase [Devosia sp.]
MRADRLSDENGRLSALRRYDILDTADEEPFRRIVELVQTVLGVPMAAVALIDAERQWLKARVGPLDRQMPREESFCGETIRHRGPMAVNDATADGRFAGSLMVTGPAHVRSYLGVPLTTPDGYHIGALCALDREPRPFDARDASILEKLAQIVVEQLELRQIARQDSMTGALTRRGFLAEAEREFHRASRYDRPSALAVIDVDNFKAINDRHGHPVGDAVLIAIANATMATMRKSDVFGRLGGEEFGLLLPETDPQEAGDAVERIRRAIEHTLIETPTAEVRVTISCGVAPIPAASQDVATWFAEADIALYEAKRAGRNRVMVGKARRPAPPAVLATAGDHPTH